MMQASAGRVGLSTSREPFVFFDEQGAARWAEAGFTPSEAESWARRGIMPATARLIVDAQNARPPARRHETSGRVVERQEVE